MQLDSLAEIQTPGLLQTLQVINNPIKFLEGRAKHCREAFTVRVMGLNSPPVVFFSNPQALKDIFALPGEKLDFQKATHVFRPLMGENSIILQEGKSHNRQRQLLMPQFHGDRLQAYGNIICQITEQVTQQWLPGSIISINRYMPDITLQIILQVVFGIEPSDRYHELRNLLSSLLDDITNPWYSSLFFFPPLQKDLGRWSPWGNFVNRRQQIDNLIYAEIAQRRLENNNSRTDILSMLMSARDNNGQQMTDIELRDQLMSLLLLGYETTAATLSWAFYLIYSSPNVRDRLNRELDTLGNNHQPDKIANLPYLSVVCQEILRIYPIALICTPRMVKEIVKIQDATYNPGTILVPCIYLAHRHAETYPQLEQFVPERFLNRKFSPYEYLPFGGGSRGCIGAAFALYEMKLIIATVMSQWQMQLAQPKAVKPIRRGITIIPAKDVQMLIADKYPPISR